MRTFLTWLLILLLSLILGIGGAVMSLRSSSFGNDIRIGPWTTGRNIGTADADVRTRAIVALRGLLALPASEARYFTARVDGEGRVLEGGCLYGIDVDPVASRWWSITVYDPDGWLIANSQSRHSFGRPTAETDPDGELLLVGQVDAIGPAAEAPPHVAIPSGTDGPIELTLRVYQPGPAYGAPTLAMLPAIRRIACPL